MEETAESSDESLDPADQTFDPAVTTDHSYLGNDLEVLRGRTLLDHGIYHNLPIIFEKSTILFPEQTLPMVEYSTHIITTLRSCIDNDRTFGVVRLGKKTDVLVGTTAEIYEYSDSETNGFRIKARGRQRFKILRVKRTQGQILADVKILPEIVLGPPFFEERIASLDCLRIIPETETEASQQEYKVSRRDSAVTPWPSWVYRQYDARRLAFKIHKRLDFIKWRGGIIPKEPGALSFWLAQNLFMNDTAKISLLRHDCAISRLQYEVKVLATFGGKSFMCGACRCVIGKQRDLISMNEEGLQEAYCNPAGAIHETVTLLKATNVVLNNEPPSTVCSWFPGYAWTIASCQRCQFHIGWRFTAVKDDLKPRAFWGLTRKNLIFKDAAIINKDQTNSSIVDNSGEEDTHDDLSSESDDDDNAQRIVHFRLNM